MAVLLLGRGPALAAGLLPCGRRGAAAARARGRAAGTAARGRRTRRCGAAAGAPRAKSELILERADAIAAGFEPAVFVPVRYAANAHAMTILGAETIFRFGPDGRSEGLDLRRRRFDTPDGDFFDVDFLLCDPAALDQDGLPRSTRPIVVLLHGLESPPQAPLFCRMARAFRRRGFDVAMLYFRSCSGELNRTVRTYNLGFTDDLDQLCGQLRSAAPERRTYLAGYSLGGNAICRYLATLGASAPSRGIYGGAVCSVPFFPGAATAQMERGLGKWLYAANFLRKLVPKVEAKAAMLEARGEVIPFDLDKVKSCSTLGQFDDAYIAPVYGFKDRWDYYERQGCGAVLKGIRVPVFAMNARDDPFINADSLPSQEEVSSTMLLHFSEKGGHCGFIAEDAADLDSGDGRNFLPSVLGDFVEHVETSLSH